MSALAIIRPEIGPTELFLSRIDEMKAVIREATSHVQVMEIRDYASALADLVRTRGASVEHINDVVELKLSAERRMGRMLAAMPKHNGDPRSHDVTRLSEIGISKMNSLRWQAIAEIAEGVYEQHIRETKEAGKELTTAGVLRLHERLKVVANCGPHPAASHEPRVVANLRDLAERREKFATIYADPPWKYGNQSTRASTDENYVTMSVEDICAEPVRDIAADDAHLHLWTTNAFLREAFDVMESWGFSYKSCFVWVKPQFGIGNYWRVSHEFMLFGVRGKCPFRSRDEKSWRELSRGEHSAKPDEIRQIIEKVSPGPYLEMYGREFDPATPWTVYGNQVRKKHPLFPDGIFGVAEFPC